MKLWFCPVSRVHNPWTVGRTLGGPTDPPSDESMCSVISVHDVVVRMSVRPRATGSVPESTSDGRLVLADGRVLAYGVYGAPEGTPLLFFGGIPSSRVMSDAFAETVAEVGGRAIVPERPGMGVSSPHRGRRVVDYADDLVALADELGIESFPVVGWAGGGPYALAVAAEYPERVTRVGLLASPAPWRGIGPAEDAGLVGRLRFWSRRFHLVNLAAALLTRLAATDPERLEWFTARLPRADQRVFEADRFREGMALSTTEAFAQGVRRVAREFDAVYGDWGFEPEEVWATVDVWHGSEDTEIPMRHGAYLVDRLPDATLHTLHGEGHYSVFTGRLGELLDAVTDVTAAR